MFRIGNIITSASSRLYFERCDSAEDVCHWHSTYAFPMWPSESIGIGGALHEIYFNDDVASQHKNYKNFSNICNHEKDHGVPAEWHFFAASHGKSPCDGVGGTVKRLVSRASLQLTTDAIDTADKMLYWCKENINGIKFFYVSKAAVETHCSLFQLEAWYARSSKIPGTRGHHGFIPISVTNLIMK